MASIRTPRYEKKRFAPRDTVPALLSLCEHEVTIHTADARATLLAMQNPSLTHEEATTIVKMHGSGM